MANNIYIFTNSYKPVLGGIQTVTSQVAETLESRGEAVTVVTNVSRKAFSPFSRICGVPVLRFHFGYRLTYIFLYLLFLLRRPKAVYVHFPLDQSPFVVKLHRHFNFKLVTCFHGHDVLRYDEGYHKSSQCYKNQRLLIAESDNVTACSKYLAEKVEQTFECKNVIPVYNGVDLSRYNAPLTDKPLYNFPYIFAFGRLEKIKGFNLLIDAFAKLKGVGNLRLLIAGSGSMQGELLQQIEKRNLHGRVELIGRKTPDEIVQLTKQAEVNVIPSLRESFGIVVLESIAAKKPIVATNAGGIPEVLDSRFGILVYPGADDIASGINKVLSGDANFDFSATDEYLKKFTIDEMVNGYLKTICPLK